MAESRRAAYKLRCIGVWRNSYKGCPRITGKLADRFLSMCIVKVDTRHSFSKPFKVKMTPGDENSVPGNTGNLCGGSPMVPNLGAGVYELKQRLKLSFSLEQYATVFQVEIMAINSIFNM